MKPHCEILTRPSRAAGVGPKPTTAAPSTHAALDHNAEALTDYNAAIHKKPDYTDAFYGRAVVLKKLGQLEAAPR